MHACRSTLEDPTDDDDPTVFERTVDWAVGQGVETATFHILTPYPGTGTFQRIEQQGRLLHRDWDRYDTRHTVFQPARMTPEQLEAGYWRAYRDFYTWRNIARGAATKETWVGRARHVAYAGGWKKFERVWDAIIQAKRLTRARPALEGVLSGLGRVRARPNPPNQDAAPMEPVLARAIGQPVQLSRPRKLGAIAMDEGVEVGSTH